jgi:5,10-methylenetetrahydrofolate reductase
LLDRGVPGLHFYSMNQYEAAEAIWRNLGIADGSGGKHSGEPAQE